MTEPPTYHAEHFDGLQKPKLLEMSFVRPFFSLLLVLVLVPAAYACPWCRARVQSDLYGSDFVGTIAVLLLPLVVLLAAGACLYYSDRLASVFNRRIK